MTFPSRTIASSLGFGRVLLLVAAAPLPVQDRWSDAPTSRKPASHSTRSAEPNQFLLVTPCHRRDGRSQVRSSMAPASRPKTSSSVPTPSTCTSLPVEANQRTAGTVFSS
jgi:hypothetical protein